MPSLVQICIVVVTLAFVAIVASTILAMIRLGQAAARLAAAAELSLGHVERIAQETHELLATAREILTPTQRVASRLQKLGDRAADLSTAILDQVEEPVLTAVAVAHGLRTGGTQLIELMSRRFARHTTSHNGDDDHE